MAFTIQMEWIKAFYVDNNIFYEEQIFKFFISRFCEIVLLPKLGQFEVIVA